MSKCIICETNDTKFMDKKCLDGTICKECMKHIPSVVNIRYMERHKIKIMYNHNKEICDKFDFTENLGELYIDSIHGMFAISKGDKKNKINDVSNVHYIEEAEELGLYCTNVRNIGQNSNNIVCDIEFFCKLSDHKIKKAIVKSLKCDYKTTSDNKLEWFEPNIVIMFRSIFNQMVDTRRERFIERVRELNELSNQLSCNNKEKERAKGIFMLNDDYTEDELKKRRRLWLKLFHPDNNKDISGEFIDEINNAYNILK